MDSQFPFTRLHPTRVLAFGGIVFIVLGLVMGEIYAIFIAHVANGEIIRTWKELISALASGDGLKMTTAFPVIEELTAKRGRVMSTHSHLGGFGFFALMLAYIQPWLKLDDRTKLLNAIIFLAGAAIYVLGIFVSQYLGSWVLYIADFGALCVIVICIRTLINFRVSGDESTSPRTLLKDALRPTASRYLVKAGFLLILVGMSFGLYYAWVLVFQDEPALYRAIGEATAFAANANAAEAADHIVQFKRMQSKIGITAAAHSHAVEFGFLMLMLAFLQRFILLTDAWRLRWARVLSIGAFALPVCVLLATKYGLRAAAFSDLFGGFVLIALLAMAYGLVRQSGVLDQHKGGSPE